MMSSRVQMHSLSGTPAWTRSCVLPTHTSVPWERPEMRISSSMVLGRVSTSMPRTKRVPNSGMPSVPVGTPSSSAVSPSASGVENRESMFLNTSGSLSGTLRGGMPVRSCRRRSMVGSSWPSTSSFTSTSCMDPKSKWVVTVSEVMSSAGCWMAVNW